MPRDDVRAKSPPVLLIVLGVAFGVAVLAGVAGIGVGFLLGKGNNPAGPVAPFAPAVQPSKAMTREEFKAAVMGKTQDEVLKAIGKPNSTNETGPDAHWVYDGKTKDTLTGKIDSAAFVWFERGVVVSVHF